MQNNNCIEIESKIITFAEELKKLIKTDKEFNFAIMELNDLVKELEEGV
jgi:hypothetical protein